MVLAGVGSSYLFETGRGPIRRAAVIALPLVAAVWSFAEAPRRPPVGNKTDAEPFLAEVRLDSLPPRTIICSHWGTSPPLWYEQQVRGRRRDVEIVHSARQEWRSMVGDRPSAVLYAATATTDFEGYTAIPERGMWRLEPP
jgi:hypothetical protein